MTTRKNSLFGLVGLSFLVGALMISGLQPVEGKEKKPAVDPVLPSEIVSLKAEGGGVSCPLGGLGFVQTFPNGDTAASVFSVPEGHVFVLTSIQVGTLEQISGTNVEFVLQRGTVSGSVNLVLIGSISIASNGVGSTSVTMPNGIVVSFGSDLCFNFSVSPASVIVFAQGYLAADK